MERKSLVLRSSRVMEYRVSPLLREELESACAVQDYDDELRGRLLWHLYTPYASVFKLQLNGAVVGYATGIVHVSTGWVREVHCVPRTPLEEECKLLQGLLQWMEAQGAATQLAIVYEIDELLFEDCGFESDGGLLWYEDGLFLQASKDEVIIMEPEHMMAVLHMDRQATGEDREQLIREHQYLGSVYMEGTRVRGFSLPLLGNGLIVADSPEVGLELQRWLLPIQPHLILPVGHLQAHAHMIQRKYTATPSGTRMVRGPRPAYKPHMIYAHP